MNFVIRIYTVGKDIVEIHDTEKQLKLNVNIYSKIPLTVLKKSKIINLSGKEKIVDYCLRYSLIDVQTMETNLNRIFKNRILLRFLGKIIFLDFYGDIKSVKIVANTIKLETIKGDNFYMVVSMHDSKGRKKDIYKLFGQREKLDKIQRESLRNQKNNYGLKAFFELLQEHFKDNASVTTGVVDAIVKLKDVKNIEELKQIIEKIQIFGDITGIIVKTVTAFEASK